MITPSNQQVQPYLPTNRAFPVQNPIQLEPELVKSYIDIALAVNVRTIGIFENIQIVTGERWFSVDPLNSSIKRQTYRKTFTFGTIAPGGTIAINHGITGITSFTRIYGTVVTNAPDYRPLPYASTVANSNIDIRVTPTQIIIASGAGNPTIISGIVVLEYLLN